LPIEGCAVVAGRTDKGVTALQQVCSFYTWRKDVKSGDIKHAISEAAPHKLKPLHVSEFIPVSESSENARTSTINDVMLGNN